MPAAAGQVSELLGLVLRLVTCPDKEVLGESLSALAYLGTSDTEKTELLVKTEAYQYGFKHCLDVDSHVREGALRLIANICAGDSSHTQLMLRCGTFPLLHQLLADSSGAIRKDVVWTVSNILAGELVEVEAVMAFEGFGDMLRALVDPEPVVRGEAAYIPYNLAHGAAGNALKLELVKHFGIFSVALQTEQTPIVSSLLLETCRTLLEVAAEEGVLPEVVRHCHETACTAAIEALVQHLNESVSSTALEILHTYLEPDEMFDTSPNLW